VIDADDINNDDLDNDAEKLDVDPDDVENLSDVHSRFVAFRRREPRDGVSKVGDRRRDHMVGAT
jgi:hypothetical protein